jgi:hypothetical protein
MDLKVYSDLKASLKKLHITGAKDVDYSRGNKTVIVISLPVFKPAIAFQTRSYRLVHVSGYGQHSQINPRGRLLHILYIPCEGK